jgi:hypothetical protein
MKESQKNRKRLSQIVFEATIGRYLRFVLRINRLNL